MLKKEPSVMNSNDYWSLELFGPARPSLAPNRVNLNTSKSLKYSEFLFCDLETLKGDISHEDAVSTSHKTFSTLLSQDWGSNRVGRPNF